MAHQFRYEFIDGRIVLVVAGLVREQQQDLHAAVLGIEVLGAKLRIVEHLGADLGGAECE